MLSTPLELIRRNSDGANRLLIYWALFTTFAVGSILTTMSAQVGDRRAGISGLSAALFLSAFMCVALLIGVRYRVGADWNNYQFLFKSAGFRSLSGALKIGDPGYQLVNWLTYRDGYQIWVVNLVCGGIFSWGLWRFSRATPFPWLAAAVSVPYVIIVVAMGYSRQAVALGIVMAGLASYWRTASILRFAAYIAVAALFHKTAVAAFPIVALSSERNKFLNLLIAIFASALLYDLFLGDSLDDYVKHYIRRGYSSQGAGIRIAMNLAAAGAFWALGRRLHFSETEWRVWRNFSVAAVVLTVFLVLSPSSTAVDRLSIYVMPLQIAVLSRIPLALGSAGLGTTAVLLYMGSVEFVWLNFAQFSSYWIPYQIFPFQH